MKQKQDSALVSHLDNEVAQNTTDTTLTTQVDKDKVYTTTLLEDWYKDKFSKEIVLSKEFPFIKRRGSLTNETLTNEIVMEVPDKIRILKNNSKVDLIKFIVTNSKNLKTCNSNLKEVNVQLTQEQYDVIAKGLEKPSFFSLLFKWMTLTPLLNTTGMVALWNAIVPYKLKSFDGKIQAILVQQNKQKKPEISMRNLLNDDYRKTQDLISSQNVSKNSISINDDLMNKAKLILHESGIYRNSNHTSINSLDSSLSSRNASQNLQYVHKIIQQIFDRDKSI